MSVLAPLYALAALAIGLPILFHFIQRQPRGRVPFSSLMFLKPSPPRLTRRSRLTNLLLLLLRAAALILLAIAFSRPFLRSFAGLTTDVPARRLAVLIDTSASMRREGLAEAMEREFMSIVDDVQPTDQVVLLSFDRSATEVMNWQQLATLPPAKRKDAFKLAFQGVRNSWHGTNLGGALVAAAESLRGLQTDNDAAGLVQHVYVLTDFQAGSDLDAVQKYEWPTNVHVDVRELKCPKPTNASLQILRSNDLVSDPDEPLRVRVENSADANRQEFRVAWVKQTGAAATDREFPVQVPPGTSRVIPVQRPPLEHSELRLEGDDHPFDNSVYLAPEYQKKRRILFLGPAPNSAAANLAFYLQQAQLETRRVAYELQFQDPTATLLLAAPHELPMVIVAAPLPDEATRSLKSYMEQGGHILCVLSTDATSAAEGPSYSAMLQQWTTAPGIELKEADVSDYAMLSDIDFQHPVFRPFADPRFNDFTKIRYRSHRTLQASDPSPWQVLATFDDDRSPALIQEAVGKGKATFMTAGWHPSESQLALSTKFIPLLMTLVASGEPAESVADVVTVGTLLKVDNADHSLQIVSPTGEEVAPVGELQLDQPGIYQFHQHGDVTPIAANLDYRESNTAPLDTMALEGRGITLQRAKTLAEIAEDQRHMRDIEIEGQQQLWRWLLVTVLALLAAETWLAHHTAAKWGDVATT